jgi:hypothetical protein
VGACEEDAAGQSTSSREAGTLHGGEGGPLPGERLRTGRSSLRVKGASKFPAGLNLSVLAGG